MCTALIKTREKQSVSCFVGRAVALLKKAPAVASTPNARASLGSSPEQLNLPSLWCR